MRSFAELPAHSRGQGHARFTKAVAETVGYRERIFPFLLLRGLEQVELCGRIFKMRGLHAEQANLTSPLPVSAKQRANLLVYSCLGMSS